MYLDSLKAINFRNYKKLDLVFNPQLNILFGDNAQGKTNLIEAVSVLALGRSFRTNRDEELIKKGENAFYLRGLFKNKVNEVIIELGNSKRETLLKMNGVLKKRKKDVFGKIKIVIFSPEDLQLIKGGPGKRREYLDIYIGQVYPAYRVAFQKYYRALYQRNALLKRIKRREKTESSLGVWTEELIKEGSTILNYRLKVLKEIEDWVGAYHRQISGEKEEIKCFYEGFGDINGGENEVEKIKNNLYVELEKKKNDEIRRGVTLIGPHRDDFTIILNKELDIRYYGSQGQQRTAALSLKMAMINLINKIDGDMPILLLDDVFSEFDNERKKELLKVLIKKTQTFITTVNEGIIEEFGTEVKSFKVEGGRIDKKNNLSK